MNNEETIYMGSDMTQNANNSGNDAMGFVVKAWKPLTIGGSACVLLGTGAILMANAQDDDLDIPDDNVVPTGDTMAKVETQPVEQEEVVSDAVDTDQQTDTSMQLQVAIVDDRLPFGDAFASARGQVGPGGVFNWRSLIFSTYTADEWEAMSEEEHEQFAMKVHPEVDASHVSDAELAQRITTVPADDTPVVDLVDDDAVNEYNVAQDDVTDDQDVMAKINEDMAAIAATDMVNEPADIEPLEQDVVADVELAQDDALPLEGIAIVEGEEGIALADIADDVMIADENDDAVIEDIALAEDEVADDAFALSEMFDLKPADDLAMSAAAVKASEGGTPFENFLSEENTVRIVGYGEFDGHQVRGLDLDGDNTADIAVIDIDDSGDLSSVDMIVEQGNGNQFTYGELQDFAMSQEHGADHHDVHAPNPDIADDMPDYMDDAIAQL